jgi:polysaccharide pyruvyl transferase WcaK-like protein
MIDSITLLGSSSGRNAGDAALIAGIMDAIDEARGEKLLYEIPTIRPSYIKDNYTNNTRPISMMPWALSLKMFGLPTFQSILRTDLSLIFDAILFDRSLYNPLFNYMSTLFLMLPRAKKKGKRFAMYNVGTGPVDSNAGKSMLRDISELMEFITVRDQASYNLLRSIGVTNPNVFITADAALTMPGCNDSRAEDILNACGLSAEESICGININRYLDTWVRPKRPSMGKEKFLEIYSQALNKFAKEAGCHLLFVCTQHHDIEVTKELMALITVPVKKALFTNVTYNHYDVKGVMGKLSMLFGMRLHATILSSSAFTPTVGLAYQPKVADYFTTIGMSERCVPFSEFTVEGIAKYLISAWEDRSSIRAALERTIPIVQEKAREPARIIARLSRGEAMLPSQPIEIASAR